MQQGIKAITASQDMHLLEFRARDARKLECSIVCIATLLNYTIHLSVITRLEDRGLPLDRYLVHRFYILQALFHRSRVVIPTKVRKKCV